MFSKKAQNKMIENLIIIFVFSGIMIFFLFYLTTLSNLSIDDKKVKAQIITKQLLRNCFSEEYGIINQNQFTQGNLDSCFEGIEETSLFRVRIENQIFYINDQKDIFAQKGQLCSLTQKSSQYCMQAIYPIIYSQNDGEEKTSFMVVDLVII